MSLTRSQPNNDPAISVVLPVYNGERFLQEAVQSVLDQTFSDLELIAVDDGSTDGTSEILDAFDDARIVRVRHERNLGLIRTLNEGFGMARGEFIVRMDADDLSLPDRIEMQVDFMRGHPDMSVSGCWMRSFGSEEKEVRFPASTAGVASAMLLNNAVTPSTVIIRAKDMAARKLSFAEKYRYENEYDFFARAIMAGLKIANIPEILYKKRSHPDQVSAFFESRVRETEMMDIQKRYFSFLMKSGRFLDPRFAHYMAKFAMIRISNKARFTYRQTSLKMRGLRFYATAFKDCFHVGCDNEESNKAIVDIATVAFNNAQTIGWQIKLMRKNFKDPYFYTVFDNSSDGQKSKEIRETCAAEKVAYVRLPHNPYTRSSSHGASLNWIYRNYIKKRGAQYFGFLDHDIFPAKETRVMDILKRQPIFGYLQERAGFWYLWAGFCFFRHDSVKKPDFMDGKIDGVGVDTGGMNWGPIYSRLDKEKIVFPKSWYEQIREQKNPAQTVTDMSLDHIEHIGDWIHIFSSSGWKKMRGQDERDEKVRYIIGGLLGPSDSML